MNKELLAQQIMSLVNEDEDFCKALVSAEDAPSVKEVLNEKGIDVSLEDVERLFENGRREVVRVMESTPDAELSIEDLESVAGGRSFHGLARGIVSGAAAFGYGCLCGVFPPAAAGAPYVCAGLTAWTTAGAIRDLRS